MLYAKRKWNVLFSHILHVGGETDPKRVKEIMKSSSEENSSYQECLKLIASEVDSYIVNTSGELENFKNRIEPLTVRWNAYSRASQERDEARLQHWELIKKNPEIQDKNKKPSKKDWEWDSFYLFDFPAGPNGKIQQPKYYMPAKLAPIYLKNIKGYIDRNKNNLETLNQNSDEYNRLKATISEQEYKYKHVKTKYDKLTEEEREDDRIFTEGMWFRYVYSLEEESQKVFGCWRPPLIPLPEDPFKMIKPTDAQYVKKQKLRNLPTARNKQEEYERYYIFLASVHDNCLPEVQQITKDIWPDSLQKSVWHYCNDYFGDKTVFLKSALERIKKSTTTSQPDRILGDTWTILGIPINVKKLRTKLKPYPILLICCLSLIVIIATYPLWHPFIKKTDNGSTASTNIFADVSKDGTILRSNNFSWKIQKSIDQDGNILYTIVDRRGDATAISVVPDNPKYTVYQSYGGMVIKYTCAEEKISDFTIKVKY